MVIAVDGPAGSGKSTIAKKLAFRLGFLYLDTGAMYRALTLRVLDNSISLDDDQSIIEEAGTCCISFSEGKVYYNKVDVTSRIRTPLVDKSISKIASIPKVREALVKIQRKIGESSDCVVEGRDTTTVVFPRAELKIFLDADITERTRRRSLDFKKDNLDIDIKSLQEDLRKRDNADMTRTVGPLKKIPDAVYLDTTALSIDEVVEKIYNLALERGLVKR